MSVSIQPRRERQYYHTDKPVRASLEVLGSSLPDAGHAELDECTRETEAVKALTCLLWEEGRQLEDQGKPQAAEEKFERAARRPRSSANRAGREAQVGLGSKVYRVGSVGKGRGEGRGRRTKGPELN